jgi:hypothetical protein
MKALCLISHEVPGDEPGRFKRYAAGEVYDLEGEPDKAYFAVYGGTEGKPQPPRRREGAKKDDTGAGV